MRQLLQLHARLITSPPPPEAVDPNLVAVKLICAAAERSDPRHAALVFHVLCDPNIVAWNSLLRALALHRLHPAALHHFRRLLAAGCPVPDEFTFTSVLKACAGLLARPDGEMAHALVLRRGFASNVFVGNSLIDMYFKFGRPDNAQRLFDEMFTRDVVSWNSLLSGYCSCGHLTTARILFDEMPERSMISLSAMITGYAQAGNLDAAREIFDEAIDRNVGCWNAMISGYAQNQKFSEAIALFREMLNSHSVEPNEVTLVSVISACAHLGALDYGRCINRFIETKPTRLNLFLGNALADMYAKCGCIAEAKAVFGKMKERDVISWNIIITGLAMHGHAEEAITMLHKMLDRSLRPNDITFMGILSACTHAGLVDAGLHYFDTMIKVFEIVPQVEHYGCIVDLLSRSGRLDEAEDLINSMQVAPNEIVWGALLGGCRIYKDMSRGERVVRRILELDPKHAGSYVYLANLYDRMGRFDDAARLSLTMRENGVVKTPGCSWIEVDNTVHEFLLGDRSHPQSEKIYAMISTLSLRMKLAGYVPNTASVTQRIDEEEKENALSMHSEKLAVAFGLISTKDHSTIRVVKNLRVCDDCHQAMKVISKIASREIVLRDRSRFHHFKEGQCSCKDYCRQTTELQNRKPEQMKEPQFTSNWATKPIEGCGDIGDSGGTENKPFFVSSTSKSHKLLQIEGDKGWRRNSSAASGSDDRDFFTSPDVSASVPLFLFPAAAAGAAGRGGGGGGRGASDSAAEHPSSLGKLRMALRPRIWKAARSYARAASTAVSKVPSQTRDPRRLGSRISAANFPHGRWRTPRYRRPRSSPAAAQSGRRARGRATARDGQRSGGGSGGSGGPKRIMGAAGAGKQKADSRGRATAGAGGGRAKGS